MLSFLPVIMAILIVVALSILLRSFAWIFRADEQEVIDDAEIRALSIEKERAVEGLRDLEFDLQLKKISQEDYEVMKGPSEIRALRAIRMLDEATQRLGVLLVALSLVMGLGAGEALAQSMGNHAVGGKGIPRETRVIVSQLEPSGERVPASGVTVLVEAWQRRMGPGNRRDRVAEAVLLTNWRGEARKSWSLPAGVEVEAKALYEGSVFNASKTGKLLFADVYAPTTDHDELVIEPRAIVSIREGMLWVQAEFLIHNEGNAVVLAEGDGVALPLLAPVAWGKSMQGLWLPEQAARHMRMETTGGEGDVQLVSGTFRYFGLIRPGDPTQIRLEYPVDIVSDSMLLGVDGGEIPIRRAMFALTAPNHIHPGLRLLGDGVRGMSENRKGEQTYLQWTATAPGPHASLRVRFVRLPHEGDLSREVAAFVVILLSFLFVLGLLRSSSQARESTESQEAA
jgi:hypothetical protein